MKENGALISGDSNAANLGAALEVVARLIRARLAGEDLAPQGELRLAYFDDGSVLGDFIGARRPPFAEYVVMLLALAPHVQPAMLDTEIRGALASGGDFPEIGGIRDPDSRTFLPTGETAAFLLAGADLEARFDVQRLFAPDHWFATENVLRLDAARDGAPWLSGRIVMSRDWVERFTLGVEQAPAFGIDFPARRVSTALDWEDLVLEPDVMERIDELQNWVRHGRTLRERWGMARATASGLSRAVSRPAGHGQDADGRAARQGDRA